MRNKFTPFWFIFPLTLLFLVSTPRNAAADVLAEEAAGEPPSGTTSIDKAVGTFMAEPAGVSQPDTARADDTGEQVVLTAQPVGRAALQPADQPPAVARPSAPPPQQQKRSSGPIDLLIGMFKSLAGR